MTAQCSETLYYKGEKLSMFTNPLSPYLKAMNISFYSTSTALWRGYVGSWAIEGQRLYLVSLDGYIQTPQGGQDVGLEYLFPDYPDGVFAHWYSGEIRCPMGELLKYVHMGYASTYEQDLLLVVDKGLIVEEKIITNGQGDGTGPQPTHIAAFTTFGKDQ